LKKEFEKLDTDSSGFLEINELVEAVNGAEMGYS
jgi:Ca2+-binding EF-hand superfamily protein